MSHMDSPQRKNWQKAQNGLARDCAVRVAEKGDYGLWRVSDAEAEVILPGSDERLKEHLRSVEMTKAQYLEKMAAAFMVETGIPASECVLVMQELPRPQYGYRFHFERRSS